MSFQQHILDHRFAQLKCCVLIPTYNNERTLTEVIDKTLHYTSKLIVINDGSSDHTAELLTPYQDRITILSHSHNSGKGMALRTGFREALRQGYAYAISLDSDGQHFPSDLALFLDKIELQPGCLIIGARNMSSENVPGGSSFGNKFSNFWFRIETGITLPDTQSGYRLYPLRQLESLRFFSTRFEFEIEVIVKAAWKGIAVVSIPIQIFYARGKERVSHFRPAKDFTRISILNTYFVILTILWYRPVRFLQNLRPARIRLFIQAHFFNKEESILKKSISVSTGIFFGIVPIWGYQLIAAIAAAYLLRLNKAIVILAANISIPPLLPFILIGSLKTGELMTGKESNLSLQSISLSSIRLNLYTYLVGACVLSLCLSLLSGIITYLILSLIRKTTHKTPS